MNYEKYVALQTRLEWFYDFHPEFFDDISIEQKELLQETFLYDAPDEDYPRSIQEFYNEKINGKPQLQQDMLLAVRAVYLAAGVDTFDY